MHKLKFSKMCTEDLLPGSQSWLNDAFCPDFNNFENTKNSQEAWLNEQVRCCIHCNVFGSQELLNEWCVSRSAAMMEKPTAWRLIWHCSKLYTFFFLFFFGGEQQWICQLPLQLLMLNFRIITVNPWLITIIGEEVQFISDLLYEYYTDKHNTFYSFLCSLGTNFNERLLVFKMSWTVIWFSYWVEKSYDFPTISQNCE